MRRAQSPDIWSRLNRRRVRAYCRWRAHDFARASAFGRPHAGARLRLSALTEPAPPFRRSRPPQSAAPVERYPWSTNTCTWPSHWTGRAGIPRPGARPPRVLARCSPPARARLPPDADPREPHPDGLALGAVAVNADVLVPADGDMVPAGARIATPAGHGGRDHKLTRAMPTATTAAATTRPNPKRSPKNTVPMTAPTTMLVSRSAATAAVAPLVWATSTSP